ncbi:MAG: GNAT family protein [Litoreibacter sp.]
MDVKMAPRWPEAFSLQGEYVSVVPLSQAHHDDLVEATADGDLHKLWYTTIPDAEGMSDEINRRRALSSMLPFAIIDNATNKAVGMTTYMNIDETNKRLEIGSTWYRKSAQKSPLNTECKLLLLQYAFENLNCIAVEFRTHFLNVQSRRAIERLGAKRDGILRSHMVMANGSIRDTAVYSIIASEWPTVEAHLTYKLHSNGTH